MNDYYVVFIALACLQAYGLFAWEQSSLRSWVLTRLPQFWHKPLGECLTCTSFWLSLITCTILGAPLYFPIVGVLTLIAWDKLT